VRDVLRPIPDDIQALVRERRKIDAIRALRERTGLGLKDARDQIDALERELGIATPMSATTKSLIYWFVLIVVGLAIYWISGRFQAR
jgi:hypothetical protein